MCQMGKAFSIARMAATADVTFGWNGNEAEYERRMSRRWFSCDGNGNERWDNVKWTDPTRDGLFIR